MILTRLFSELVDTASRLFVLGAVTLAGLLALSVLWGATIGYERMCPRPGVDVSVWDRDYDEMYEERRVRGIGFGAADC